MGTISSAAMAIAVIASFLLTVGGIRLMLGAETRGRGALMLTAAAVLMANVLIWTL
jgi:high-affinity Fe2+/Pb2+ permease